MADTVLDVIKRGARLFGGLATGDDPTGEESNDLLRCYNNMFRGFFGTIIGPRVAPSVATTSLTGQTGYQYTVGSAAITLTLPPDPRAGARIGFADGNAGLSTNNLIVNRNGHLLEGAAANLTISTNGTNRMWFFRPDAANWVREADALLTDSPPFSDDLIGYMAPMFAVAMQAEYGGEIRADVVANAQRGYAAFARVYARRGRNQMDPPLGVLVSGQTQGG